MDVNAKMILAQPVLGIRAVGMKESSGRGEFNYDILDTL
jgi:hypothetical protein